MRVAAREARRHQIRVPGARPDTASEGPVTWLQTAQPCPARKAPGFPFSIARDTSGSSFGFALKEPDLTLVPGGQPGKGPGPVLPAQPGHRRQHDGGKGRGLVTWTGQVLSRYGETAGN